MALPGDPGERPDDASRRTGEAGAARAEVVDASGQPPDRVRFGVTVRVEDLSTGDRLEYTIVDEEEADAASGRLSVTSPVARSLIGKAISEVATVRVPAGVREFEVLEIWFGSTGE